jgi:hypothetical protein
MTTLHTGRPHPRLRAGMDIAKLARSIAAGAMLGALAVGAAAAETPPWQTLGLMRVRDMTPFGISRLDMLPAHGVSATPGTFAFELNYSHQNTWALSQNVRDYLTARGGERDELSGEDLDAILAMPGDSYLVDGEFGVTDLTLHYRATRRFAVNFTVPYYAFGGGFLDSTIESFHDAAGFSSAGRDLVPRDRFLAVGNINGARVRIEGPPDDGFSDPVLGVRVEAVSGPRCRLVVESAAKLAVRSPRLFVASGHEDYGLQLSLQRFLRRNAFYLTVSGVHYQPADERLGDKGWIPTAVAGWETRVSRNTNFILQGYVSRSTLREAELDELAATKIQVTIGLQRLYRGYVLRFGITENVANYDNTPDVGANLSIGRILFGGR